MYKVAVLDSYPGNGHCYSFSAIINGVSRPHVNACPFETIKNYILKHRTPDPFLNQNFEVASVWMRDASESVKVANFANISRTSESVQEAIEGCDVLMLLNDEPDSRNSLLTSLLETQKPIFVDKLLTRSEAELNWFKANIRYETQVFSSSSLQFSVFPGSNNMFKENTTTVIEAPKSWSLYGIHVIEFFLRKIRTSLLSYEIESSTKLPNGGRKVVVKIAEISKCIFHLVATGEERDCFVLEQYTESHKVFSIELRDPYLSFCAMLRDYLFFLREARFAQSYWEQQLEAIRVLNA